MRLRQRHRRIHRLHLRLEGIPQWRSRPLRARGARNLAILVLLAAVGFGLWYYFKRTGTVIIGTKDQVTYSGLSTEAQATALGNALKTAGFFTDQGFQVLLHKPINGSVIISYVLKDGSWNDPAMVSDAEALTRDVAASVGGLQSRCAW